MTTLTLFKKGYTENYVECDNPGCDEIRNWSKRNDDDQLAMHLAWSSVSVAVHTKDGIKHKQLDFCCADCRMLTREYFINLPDTVVEFPFGGCW